MTPNSLETRLARTEERIAAINRQLVDMAKFAGDVPTLTVKLEDVTDDVLAIRMTLERIERDYREDLRARQEARQKQTSTVIAASATVMAAVVGAIALLWASGAIG